MAEFQEHAPGTFCWAELVTGDAAATKGFYRDLFGWTFHDDPVGEGVYTMFEKGGLKVGAQYAITDEQSSQGVPPNWGTYVSVADLEAALAKVEAAGGEVLMPPYDVYDVGRMTVCKDPTGAVLSLWQPLKHIGCQLKDETGSLCWTELLTNDTGKARDFYTSVFGWSTQTMPMGNMEYTVFQRGEEPTAGMMLLQEFWGPMPPHWMLYFAVEDCDASIEQALSLGGEIVCPAQDIPSGRFCILKDPGGAMLGIFQMREPG